MSTYVDEALNPETGKLQKAVYIDDFYGSHHYGVAFKKDGSDATFQEITTNANLAQYHVYPLEVIRAQTSSDKNRQEL